MKFLNYYTIVFYHHYNEPQVEQISALEDMSSIAHTNRRHKSIARAYKLN